MITEPTEPQNDSEDFWPSDEQKQDLLKPCGQITGESQPPSPLHRRHPNRGHQKRLRGFLTTAAAMVIALGLLSMGWFSSFYFFSVAEQAKELQIQAETFENEQKQFQANQAEKTLPTKYETDMTDICEVMKAIIDQICNNSNNINSICSPYTGVESVSSSDWTTLESLLDSVKSKTDTIFSSINPPSYTPYDIGSPSIYDPDGKSTKALGDDACAMARVEYERICGDRPPHQESSANYLRDLVVIIDALIIQADPG